MKKSIYDVKIDKLQEWLISIGQPKYRAAQIFTWLYQKKVVSFLEMKNIPKALAESLNAEYEIFQPGVKQKFISKIDGTVKYLLQLYDDELIETVVIPAGERTTICLSTQVGCKFRCEFCASGMYGFKRNLSQGEILSQLLIAQREGYVITNIVFMGTGEPLDNFDNVVSAVKMLNSPDAFNIGARRITISTAGIPEKIKELSQLGLQIELSLSLHSADESKRSRMMPINRKYPLKEVMSALKEYSIKTKRIITFEYIVIKGTNDSESDVDLLIKLFHPSEEFKCKVNLIPYSPVKEMEHKRPDSKEVESIRQALEDAGINVTVRHSKGADILAACGQLRIKE